MAGITLQQAQAALDAWVNADIAVSKGQSYTIAGRSLNRANATEITNKLTYWSRQVERLSSGGNGGIRARYGVPQ